MVLHIFAHNFLIFNLIKFNLIKVLKSWGHSNWLNIKKVMSKNIMSPYNVFSVSFETFDISITALTVYFDLLLTPLTYIALQPLQCIWASFD